MFSLICVTVNIQVFSSGSNAGIETSTSLINAIVDNALCNSYINQMPPQIVHILCFFLVDSLPQIL